MNHGSELPGEHLNRALFGVLLVPIPLYPSILPLIFTEARGEDPSKCEIERPAFSPFSIYFVSVRLCFSKGSKVLHFQGLRRSQEHKRELGIDLRYLAHIIGAKPSEMEKWFELKVIFFDMIFAFCRSAAFVEAQASYSTVIPCGKGRGRGQ